MKIIKIPLAQLARLLGGRFADKPAVEIKETRRRLVKYEGDPPKPGEDKEPFEIIELFDDGRPSRVVFRRPGQPPESYANLPYEPQRMEE